MFNTNLGNAKVNGHSPGMPAKRAGGSSNGSIGKVGVTSQSELFGSPQSPTPSAQSNGPVKFSDRLKVALNAGCDMVGVSDGPLNNKDDPYAFDEPETAVLHQYQNTAASAKVVNRTAAKSLPKRSSSIGEPTGLNMTRLYPAISTSVGHSFFSPQSPQSAPNSSHADTKTTLASLLESSILPDDSVPKSSSELEKAFSFTTKELNCFPNLTSPQPPEHVITSPTTPVVTSKVTPVTHGSPVTPQRESNKLAALFSPTYPNSLRADKGSRLSKVARTSARDSKTTLRITPNDRRSSVCGFEKVKEGIKPSSVVDVNAWKKSEEDEYSKTTMHRLQAKIARNRVTGKHKKVDSIRNSTDPPQRRHSLNDIAPKKERSLLEEQLVSQKPAKVIKKEPVAGASPPSIPAATTRVPGASGTLTHTIGRVTPNTSPSSGRSSVSSRQPKPQATYSSPKSSKNVSTFPLSKQNAAVSSKSQSAYGSRSNSLTRNSSSSPSYLLAKSNQSSRPLKRPRLKVEPETVIKHEALQRLQPSAKSVKADPFVISTTLVETDSEDSDLEEGLVYQKHWFSGWREAGSGLSGEERREGRLSQLRAELRRKLRQVLVSRRDPAQLSLPTCVMDAATTKPSQTAVLLNPNHKVHRTGRCKISMLVQRKCVYTSTEGEDCSATALPCARHCSRHIMYNVDQLLFEHCTAKFADNTQCCVPVFDFCHELPLCLEHARKRDNYNRMCQESKPKKPRRKAKPSAMTRSSKRSKKKKKQKQRVSRSQSLPVDSVTPHDSDHFEASLGAEVSSSPSGSTEIYVTDEAYVRINEPEPIVAAAQPKVDNMRDVVGVADVADVAAVDVGVEEVLDLPLDATDLAEQASRLLEEHDLTNVLNQIPADAFNDLFIEDKNGEPTREETEELERALAAVDKDVKSLERMSQNHILLDDLSAKGLAKLPPGAQELLPVVGASGALDPTTPAAQVFLDIEKLAQAPVLFDDKLSNAHGLLENLLDDQALVQTLTAQLPDISAGTNACLNSGAVVPVYYHNGYTVTGGVPTHNVPLYQTLQPTSNIAGSVMHTQTDLQS